MIALEQLELRIHPSFNLEVPKAGGNVLQKEGTPLNSVPSWRVGDELSPMHSCFPLRRSQCIVAYQVALHIGLSVSAPQLPSLPMPR